ncbi:MAG: flagellar assembly protein FliW [Fibromonadaceae bacterium]|jgi:flagellar assembly factor FliW|nr:flagellar assembly protein FliW [Fibromonadaceae bacterium]
MDTNRSFVFESGFPGFPGLRNFRLEKDEAIMPLEWLISVEDPDVSFIVVNPMLFRPNYAPRLTAEHGKSIGIRKGISKPDDLRLLVIVTLKENYEESTANLAAPLMFNLEECKAVQIMLDDGMYSSDEPIFAEAAAC